LTSGGPVDLGWTKAANGVGEINGVGIAKVVEGEAALCCAGVCLKNELAMHAGDEAALDGRGEEPASALDEDVVVGSFGDFTAFVEEENFVVAGLRDRCKCFDVERAVGGLVEVHGIERVDALGRESDAERLGSGDFFGEDLAGDLKFAIG